MALHHRTHPEYVAGCYGCKLTAVNIAPSVLVSSAGGARAARLNATEKQWDRDGEAYKRMRKDGLMPHDLDGAARWEASDASRFEIEAGRRFHNLTDDKLAVAAEISRAAVTPVEAA
jgi:hypothetical protein